MFAVGVRRVEVGEEVREVSETATEGVVFRVVEGLEVVAAADTGFAVGWVLGFVGEEVMVSEEAGFVVAKFANHGERILWGGRGLEG